MKKSLIFLLLLAMYENICAQKISLKVDTSGVEVVGIPSGFVLDYVAKDTIKVPTYYVIISPNYDTPKSKAGIHYDDFMIFFGKIGRNFSKTKLLKPAIRYRDGGTTYISSGLGVFYFPRGHAPGSASLIPSKGKGIPLIEFY